MIRTTRAYSRTTGAAQALTETERAILANFVLSLATAAGVGFAFGKIIFGA